MDKESMVYEYTHTHTHSAILLSLNKEILSFAMLWMNLVDISEISQAQKDKYCIFSHMESKGELMEAESRMVITKNPGRYWGDEKGYKIPFRRNKVQEFYCTIWRL
jgi:hypothetical protein